MSPQIPPQQPNNLPEKKQTNPETTLETKTQYFGKWSRIQVQNAIENGQAVSLYVENIPTSWTPSDIYRITSKYGEVMDVYVPKKKSRQGKRFCFGRFRVVRDIQRLLFDINRIYVEKGPIRANVARVRSKPGKSPGRRQVQQVGSRLVKPGMSFTAAVKGLPKPSATQNSTNSMAFIPTSDTMSWLSRCLVGKLKKPTDMESVIGVWELHGYEDVKISDFGGDSILLCFPSQEPLTQFLQEILEWVNLWFSSVRVWRRGDRVENRRCWLSIRGVSLHAWCLEFFALVGAVFGKLVSVDVVTEQKQRLDEARIEVLTTQGRRIDRELETSEPTDEPPSECGGGGEGGSPAELRPTRDGIVDADPFQLMPITTGSNIRDDKGVTEVGMAHKRNGVVMKSPVIATELPQNIQSMTSGDMVNHNQTQSSHGAIGATESPSNSKGIQISNSFGPLTGNEMQLPTEPNNSHVSPSLNGTLGRSISVSSERPALREEVTQTSNQRQYSFDARYIQFLEERLTQAIQAGRVNRGRKFKRIRSTESVASVDSSINSDIRRINIRLSQQGASASQQVSFTEVEAQETVAVGSMLGWDDLGVQQHMTSLAKTLVEKEAFEWSKSQTDV
ncbi:hypothetical protein Tsubulata_045304 [Turnera subulata]|uniref:RRM domain-containing protein n=1 Tax=Turnera subulata TaxID=218843 RepID=A0A9Q0J585_9ROSI|nr:hypothetical protein Tsubulata_045304 [Turnera subulata]